MDQQIPLSQSELLPSIRRQNRIKVTIPVQTIAIETTRKIPHAITPLKSHKSEFLRPKKNLKLQSPNQEKSTFASALASAMQQYEFPLIQSHLSKPKHIQQRHRRKKSSVQSSPTVAQNPIQNTKIRSIILNLILAKKLKQNLQINPQGVLEAFKTKTKVLRGQSPKKKLIERNEIQFVFPLIKEPTPAIPQQINERSLNQFQESKPRKPPVPTPPKRKQKDIQVTVHDPLQGWGEHDANESDHIYTSI